jgi:hypothetical protein
MDSKNKKLSLVIASGAGGDFLFRCLDSLRDQVSEHEVDIIVVDRCGGKTLDRLSKEYPSLRTIQANLDHRPSVPELRAIGVKSVEAEIVAIIEEHCVAPPHWIKTILDSFQEGDAAIGGPILDSEFTRLRDWVVYFSEYHNYLPPWPEGKRYMLNGANIAYDREELLKYVEVLGQGYWEIVLHPHLIKDGAFRSVPSMGVHHTGPFNYGYYLRQRYLLSRVWGGTQKEKVSLVKRLIYLAAAPIIPLFLLGRISSRVLKNKKLLPKYLLTLPLLIPVLIAYLCGEWTGYLLGVGDALEKVE